MAQLGLGGPDLLTEGTPIQVVRGFFPNDANEGWVTWNGPGITTVAFSMAHAEGSIQITQMGQAFPTSIGNSIVIEATPAYGVAQIHLAISDSGALPEVDGFVVQRHALYPCNPDSWQTVHCVTSRQAGTVSHLSFYDTNSVQPHTQYVYRVLGWSSVPCLPDADQYAFQREFDPTGWGFEIVAFVSPHAGYMDFAPRSAMILRGLLDQAGIPAAGGIEPPSVAPTLF